MNGQFTVTRQFHVARQQHGRKQLRGGETPDVPVGRVPRVARLLALAIRCEKLICDGAVADQSELARFGRITTARMTQIMSLLNLAPDLQQQILFLPRIERGRDVVKETDIRPIAPRSTGANSDGCGWRYNAASKTTQVRGRLRPPRKPHRIANKPGGSQPRAREFVSDFSDGRK